MGFWISESYKWTCRQAPPELSLSFSMYFSYMQTDGGNVICPGVIGVHKAHSTYKLLGMLYLYTI